MIVTQKQGQIQFCLISVEKVTRSYELVNFNCFGWIVYTQQGLDWNRKSKLNSGLGRLVHTLS